MLLLVGAALVLLALLWLLMPWTDRPLNRDFVPRIRNWTPEAILDKSIELNNRVDGAWVSIGVHPMFGVGFWVVRIEPLDGEPFNISSTAGSIAEAPESAERWLTVHEDADGIVRVW